jgi:hypothetical protein
MIDGKCLVPEPSKLTTQKRPGIKLRERRLDIERSGKAFKAVGARACDHEDVRALVGRGYHGAMTRRALL